MAMDLVTLIFQDLLKISPELLARYPTVQDKLLYLILIPHVVLLMVLIFFANSIVRGHSRLRNLILIVSYIYVIYSGFYGSFVVPIAVSWFMILIPLFFIGFFILWIFPYEKTPAVVGLLYHGGRKLVEKGRARDIYMEELRSVNRSLSYLLSQGDETINIPENHMGRIDNEIRRGKRSISEMIQRGGMSDAEAKAWQEELNRLINWREEIIKKLRRL